MTRATRALMLLVTLAFVVGAPMPAYAGKPVVHEKYAGTDSFDEADFCGIAVHFEVQFSGVFTIRPVKGSDGQAFFGHDNYRFTEIISTEEGWIRTEGNGMFHEQKARHVAGDIWEFQFVDAGTFRVFDSTGRRLLNATGVFKAREQFDLLGDSEPGGVPVPGTFEVLARHGKDFSDEEFCAAVLPELT